MYENDATNIVKTDLNSDPSQKNHLILTHIAWGFFSFLFPVVGITLCFAWMNYRPLTSKVTGLCGLFGLIGSLIVNYYL